MEPPTEEGCESAYPMSLPSWRPWPSPELHEDSSQSQWVSARWSAAGSWHPSACPLPVLRPGPRRPICHGRHQPPGPDLGVLGHHLPSEVPAGSCPDPRLPRPRRQEAEVAVPVGTPPTSRYAAESDAVRAGFAGKPHTWPSPGSPVGRRVQWACELLPRHSLRDLADPGVHLVHPSRSRGGGPR